MTRYVMDTHNYSAPSFFLSLSAHMRPLASQTTGWKIRFDAHNESNLKDDLDSGSVNGFDSESPNDFSSKSEKKRNTFIGNYKMRVYVL